MRDFHCHLLPGLDDGSPSIEESLRMAALLAEFGFTGVCCTPHFLKGCYEPSPDLIRSRIQLLQQRIDDASIPLDLLSGMEYCLDEYFVSHGGEPLTLADSGVVLAEIPYGGVPEIIYDHVERIVAEGYTPLIAHPERCPLLFDERERSRVKPPDISRLTNLFRRVPDSQMEEICPSALFVALREAGCRFQGNLGSFSGVYGAVVRSRASYLQSEGLYDCMGTDGHSADALSSILHNAEEMKAIVAKGMMS